MSTPVPILLYHNISSTASPQFKRWAVSPEIFNTHLEYLRDRHFTPLTVTQFAHTMSGEGDPLPDRPVVITFDDGLADFYTGALPILKTHGFCATLFIVTGYVGETSRWLKSEGEGERPMLNWEQISEINASGIECGTHSHSHPQLDTLSHSAARDEIVRSKEILEKHLGRSVTSMAYPHGYHSAAVKRITQETGYSVACGVKHALSATNDDRFALARIIVTADTVGAEFGALVAGKGLRIAPQERLETKIWRWVRRSKALLTHQSNVG